MTKARVERLEVMPPCSRCSRQVLLMVRLPIGDGVELELCEACDTDGPAAQELAAMLAGPVLGKVSGRALGELVLAWQREALAARGWVQIPDQKPSLN
jgi:hypothetical protein